MWDTPTYGEKLRQPLHRSFFREFIAKRARPVREGEDPVQEYLLDQANLRGFLGAFSDRDNLGELDPTLSNEEIVVGLLQPHARADLRLLKLVVRMLQSGQLDADRLLFLARRERALLILAWLLELIPEQERHPPIQSLLQRVQQRPPRGYRAPKIRYDPRRLLRHGNHP
ncbi:MAG: hypothetical protein V3T05_10090 [Myxococcota bacterium]